MPAYLAVVYILCSMSQYLGINNSLALDQGNAALEWTLQVQVFLELRFRGINNTNNNSAYQTARV
jgi:hypothetical protein